MLISYGTVCWFLFILWWGMQIWALLTRTQCRVSDTQVTVKALGPLVKHSPSGQTYPALSFFKIVMLMKHIIIHIVDHDTDKHNNDAFIKRISFKTNRRERDGSVRVRVERSPRTWEISGSITDHKRLKS